MCPDEIIVEGTLKVQEKKDDGYIVSIFEMDVSEREAGCAVGHAVYAILGKMSQIKSKPWDENAGANS